jgi:predicted PurR-regulated permease PerM
VTAPGLPSRGLQIIAAACTLAVLYFGREVLAPLALAAVMSLAIAPLKRKLARLGLGHTGGTLVSVVLLGACVAWLAVVLTSQLFAMAGDLPQYKEAVRAKLEKVRDVTIGPLERMETELAGVVPRPAGTGAKARAGKAVTAGPPPPAGSLASLPTATDTAARIASSMWGPLAQAGIVLVLLVFILLEHEGLRDRMIRLAGEAEAGRTMQAIEDAAHGVAHFFLCQFLVNLTFGAVLALSLWLLGIPHAALWGAVGALARFVPYVGPLAAGGALVAFAAAVDPGWTLMFSCMALYVTLELLTSNAVEPQLYGHSSGLAPLGVIVSALFWGSLWGPLGLLLSTPMTLCLVVAGRHVRMLEPISIVLGEPPGLTAALRLYQRALSGEPLEIVAAARIYLRRSNFARYCDQVLLPGLALAAQDFQAGRIGGEQQDRIRVTVAAAAAALGAAQPQQGARRRRRSMSLLDATVGAHLHAARDQQLGRWQGAPPRGSSLLVLCVGSAQPWDALLSGLLVQALRDEGIDARGEPMQDETLETIFLDCPLEEELESWREVVRELRSQHPRAMLVAVELTATTALARHAEIAGRVDLVVRSFHDAVAFVLAGRAATA